MVVYFTMLFLTVAFAFMAVYYKNDYCLQINSIAKSIVIKRKNIFAFLSFLSICITSALRYNVGVDFHSYYWMYSVIANGDKIHAEKGYRFLNELLINFTSEPQAIFVVTSIIITGLFFYGCFKYSPKPAMSLFLFITMGYLFSSFNILRQYIAIALIFASLKLIKENKFLPFLLIILVAMTFHKTAIIMIPLFFLTRLRLKQSYMVVISIICACFVPLRGVLTNILVKIFYPQYAGTNLIQPLSKFEFIYYACSDFLKYFVDFTCLSKSIS
ncbi:MAG: EpsG family protein [Oscillospiraceae bacterium]